jgi:type II secretory pathway component PulF
VFLGPLAIVVVGLIVGSVALGLLLPLLRLIRDLA